MLNTFYKYTDADGCKKILRNLQLLYTSPDKFNDPFDCALGLRINYEHENFGALFIGKLYQLLFSGCYPKLINSPKKAEILELWKNGDDKEKIKFLEEVRTGWEEKGVLIGAEKEKERHVNIIMSKCRAFCVSKTPYQLLMWAHYADKHKGAVIKLTIPENPPGSWRFKEVTYSDEFPVHNTTEQLVNSMLGLWRPDPEETAEKLLFTKSSHWEYENEWRDVIMLDGPDNFEKGKHLICIEKKRLVAIYFGLGMEKEDRREVMEITDKKLPHLEIYEAKKDENRFKIVFSRLN